MSFTLCICSTMLDFNIHRVLCVLSALGWLSQSKGMILQPTPMGLDSTTPSVLAQPTARMMARRTGNVNRAAVFPRAPVTCGYQSANAEHPVTCAEGQVCVFDKEDGWGPYCCSRDSSGSLEASCNSAQITTCVDYGAVGNGYLASTRMFWSQSLLW